ncbi:MAG TPA: triphosphoribosyl-dephospho-CoA synthase [Steroidobacteraceae bacterium]|nr:triphosphoribosyl-dephospho-CoA synthase [Steroidobacteraceae bacterium]
MLTVVNAARSVYSSPESLADRAVRALAAEAVLTPKPALVDERGPGAHRDLDLARLLRSAAALRDGFRLMAECASGRMPSQSLREDLGAIGRNAEIAMLAATGGSNAHRGAVWVLGLLVAGRSICGGEAFPAEVTGVAAAIARFTDRHAPATPTNGSRVCARFGVPGARGEARAGFPHVVGVGLPALRRGRQLGLSATHSRLDALLAIMAKLPDTCLLHRGGLAALEAAQAGARAVLAAGGTSRAAGWRALLALDAELLSRWASPGGCADLLTACLFLDDAWKE